jgi:hypothetical protein
MDLNNEAVLIPKPEPKLTPFQAGLCGYATGMFANIVTFPFERTKTVI